MTSLHLICNAHIDPVWQWNWAEGMGEALSTFRIAADMCDKFDAFVFNHNESLLYQTVEQQDPVLFERIVQLVEQGKWHILGGWYLQPDCNLPSGESILRHILTGRRYFAEKFGVVPTIAFNPDPFGHSRGLVQILQKTGFTGYLFMRPDPSPYTLTDLSQDFLWEGYEGSTVIGHRLNTSYNSPRGNAAQFIEEYIQAQGGAAQPGTNMRLWGVGNHGGGPSYKDLQDIEALIEQYKDEIDIHHAIPEEYFDGLNAAELPRFTRDLNPIFVGCYTSMPAVKYLHRRLESQLMLAEKMSSQASLCGLLPYPDSELDKAEKSLLFCQFHDILTGACVPSAEKQAIQKLCYGLQICEDAIQNAFFALAKGQPQAQADTIPILLYNPHPYPVEGIFSCEYMLPDQNWSDLFTDAELYDGKDRIPSQLEKEQSNINLDWRKRITFFTFLPPMSMKRLDCKLVFRDRNPQSPQPITESLSLSGDKGRLVMKLSADGRITQICFRDTTVTTDGLGELTVFRDSVDPWEMQALKINEQIGKFRLMTPIEAASFTHCVDRSDGGFEPLRIIEDGDVRTVVEGLYTYASSSARITYALSKHSPVLDIDVTLYWNEKDALLRMRFPHAFNDADYTVQDMYGSKSIPEDESETVGHAWSLIRSFEKNSSMQILSDISYGYMANPHNLYANLLRSPAYTAHPLPNRRILSNDRFSHRSGQGEWHFRFRVRFGTPATLTANCETETQAFLEMPDPLPLFSTSYDQPAYTPHPLRLTGATLTSMHPDISGEGFVVRLFNPLKAPCEATLEVEGTSHSLTFGPFEIKSYRILGNRLTEISLLESSPICS